MFKNFNFHFANKKHNKLIHTTNKNAPKPQSNKPQAKATPIH